MPPLPAGENSPGYAPAHPSPFPPSPLPAGENSPGYAPARAYLEVLSELPWSRLSSHTATTAAAVAATSSDRRAAGGGTGPATCEGGHSGGGAGGPSAAATALLSLRQARAMLDEQHYGLDKIKDRCGGGGGAAGVGGVGAAGKCMHSEQGLRGNACTSGEDASAPFVVPELLISCQLRNCKGRISLLDRVCSLFTCHLQFNLQCG